MKTIVAFGNPLLDTTINIKDRYLLTKHNLKDDGAKEIGSEEMQKLLGEISSYEQVLTAGGSAQNTLRVMQWLTGKQYKTVIFGSVGSDDLAGVLRELIEQDGVETRYIVQFGMSTGTTVALVNGGNRSLVACVAAAENLPWSALHTHKDFTPLLLDSNLVYLEGFFLTKRLETARHIIDFCNDKQKLFAFNISAEYICEEHPNIVQYFLEKSDIVFGNKREYIALCKILKTDDYQKMAKDLTRNRSKIIVVTDGPKTVTCFHQNGVEMIDVPFIKPEDVVDTTGAGDAFVAGFLTGYLREKSMPDCMQLGCYAALNLVQQTGCTLPLLKPDLFAV